MGPRMGRPPSDNPKNDRITVRFNKETLAVLNTYCEQESVDKAEAIRRGIEKLKGDIRTK